jgi:hypothetical protein
LIDKRLEESRVEPGRVGDRRRWVTRELKEVSAIEVVQAERVRKA